MFKVEIRKDCIVCGNVLPIRFRTYCSKTCRYKAINKRHRAYQKKWMQDKRGEYSDNKIQCPECDKWYVQVASHVIQAHQYDSAREFKETNGLDVKRGVVPDWYRQLKGEQVFENGTVDNLKIGKKFWFKKGQEGVGIYKRSKQTIERLKKQAKYIHDKHNTKSAN